MTGIKGFIAFYEHLKSQGKGDLELRADELERAVREMLRRAKIANFEEYIRSYKYKRRGLDMLQKMMVYGRRDPGYRALKDMFRSSMELLGHSGQVDRICFDQGNRFFMSGGADGMVKLWDVHSGFLVHSFIGHRNLVSDLCVSSDGKVLVSCDIHGLLSIWSLEEFEILFQLGLECEIIFTEFFDTNDTSAYNLIVVLSRGIIKTYRFDGKGVISESENLCLLDEAIKGLCFTEGGRFLLCSGWWPFLVVFDTQSFDGCIILETNGMPVNTICGAKRGLKIAAACDSQVFQWTFFTEGNSGMGNFKRRTKDTSLQGHWKRSIIKIDIGENESVERICYLRDNFLVCICTDLKIRIFAGTELRCVIDTPEMGIAYPHPLENVFALCGSSLRIYNMHDLVYEEVLSFTINDAQFSNDGEFFVFGDERGVIKVLSMNFLPRPPKEQFFLSDLDHLSSAEWRGVVKCRKESTYESDRRRNEDWVLVEYTITGKSSSCTGVEDLGSRHLVKDFVNLEAFRRKYMNAPLPGEAQVVEQTTMSSDSSVDLLDDSSSGLSEESADCSSEEAVVEERRAPLRRFLVDSSESSERIPMLRRNAHAVDDSDGGLEPTGMVRRLRRFNRPRSGVDEESGIRFLSLRGGDGVAGDALALYTGVYGGINDSERSEVCENSDDRYAVGPSEALGHNEQGLKQYVQSWLSSPGMVPQPGDAVYLSSEGLEEFQAFDTRRRFRSPGICSGYYEVRTLEVVRYSPPFLKVTLGLGAEAFVVKYYRYPGASPVLLLKEQVDTGIGDSVSFVSNGIISQGRVSGVRGVHLVVDSGGNSVLVERPDVLVPRMLFPEDVKMEMLGVLRQKRMHRSLYVTLRRESNASYYESVASTVNLGIIEEKIQNDLYRTVGGLEFDLGTAASNSLYLGPVLHGHCQQVVDGIRLIIRSI